MSRALFLAIPLLFGLSGVAAAQSAWYTPGGSVANGSIILCLNASNQAVPVSSGQCAGGSSPLGTVSITPGTCSSAAISLTAAVSAQILAATANLKSFEMMNIGVNPVTLVDGAGPAVVGNGFAINGATATGQQGGYYSAPVPPTNALQAISTLGTTVIVRKCQ
jgi:hypothetical protein